VYNFIIIKTLCSTLSLYSAEVKKGGRKILNIYTQEIIHRVNQMKHPGMYGDTGGQSGELCWRSRPVWNTVRQESSGNVGKSPEERNENNQRSRKQKEE